MSYKWPTTKSESDYMSMRQNQNIERSKNNKAENWFNEKLKNCKYKFNRQKRWGYRIYDFWCHELGLAIEIDGADHNKSLDALRDKQDFERSRIIVLRVRNFDEGDAYFTIQYLLQCESWNERRTSVGLKPIKN